MKSAVHTIIYFSALREVAELGVLCHKDYLTSALVLHVGTRNEK